MRDGWRPPIAGGLLAVVTGLAAAADDERRAGDFLATALPAATLATELWRGDGEGAWQFARSFGVTVLATEALKRTTGVERPDGSNDLSFPSGHASRAFAAAAYVHRRHGFDRAWPLYALATYVGHTRVQADRHHWTDIAGSAGVAWLSSAWLVDRKGQGLAVGVRRDGVAISFGLPLR